MRADLARESGPGASQRLRATLDAYLPRIGLLIKEIRRLDPPHGEGWQVTAFIIALKEGIYTETKTDSTHPPFNRAFAHSIELAHALGVNDCARKASASIRPQWPVEPRRAEDPGPYVRT